MAYNGAQDLVNLMIEEIQNHKKLELCDELFAENFINYTPPANIANNREGIRQVFSMTHVAFPDGHITVKDQISDGKKVWTRKVFAGTLTGALGAIAPTGKTITYEVIDILSVQDDKITEHWSVIDRLNLMRQLGQIV